MDSFQNSTFGIYNDQENWTSFTSGPPVTVIHNVELFNTTSVVDYGLRAAFFAAFGTAGIILNTLAVVLLPGCGLPYSTWCIMTLQSFANIISLIPATLYSPSVLCDVDYLSFNSGLILVPGSMIVFGGNASQAIQVCMAVNRVIAIHYTTLQNELFSKKRSQIMAICVLIYAAAWTMPQFFPCCYTIYHSQYKKWYAAGYAAALLSEISLVPTTAMMLAMTVCYLIVAKNLRSYKLQIVGTGLNAKAMKREVSVLAQYITIGIIWMANSLMTYIFQFLPDAQVPALAIASEVVRYILYTVDPLIYMIFLSSLRSEFRKKFCCKANAVGPEPHAIAPVRAYPNTDLIRF